MEADKPKADDLSPDLPPCPYCGAPDPAAVSDGVRWVISCIGCPGHVVGRTRDVAETAWRDRTGDSELRRR